MRKVLVDLSHFLEEPAGRQRARLLGLGYALSDISMTRGSLQIENSRLSWAVSKLQQQWYHRINYSAEVTNMFLVDKIISWMPFAADKIEVVTGLAMNAGAAFEKARRSGLNVTLLTDNRIEIKAKPLQWLGFQNKDSFQDLSIDFLSETGGTVIRTESMPYEGGTDWSTCVRLLVRLAVWLGAEAP